MSHPIEHPGKGARKVPTTPSGQTPSPESTLATGCRTGMASVPQDADDPMRPIGEPVDVHMPDGTTVQGEWRIETPKTPSGISLFHHLTFPDDYGWPTDEQLASAIRKVEDEEPPNDYSGLVMIGLWVVGIVVGWLARGAA